MRNAGRKGAGSGTGLHVCPRCSSRLVQPTSWEETERRGCWRLWRRCPECDWRSSSVHGEREINAYDEELDYGTAELAGELKDLQRHRMAELAEAFVTALRSDLITADDFL